MPRSRTSVKIIQPQVLLSEVVATNPVAFGAAAMILHGIGELG
ncbi:hypothetical protein O8B41_06930 [Agrobacterium rhizogenes]|nr:MULTISPECIES: hypothetical protein [Rhizobium/Agrobacterium group]MCZ7468916.1 hypothetical protein [Rhizobium rhizogenes]